MRGALLVLGVCLALVAGGCGGGEGSTSTSSTGETSAGTPQASKQDTTTAQGEGKGAQNAKGDDHASAAGSSKPGSGAKGDGSSAGEGDNNNASSKPQRVKVPRISSAPVAGSRKPAPGVKTVKGADNSVQEYGVESDSSERREAAITLQAYLNARADEDWGLACSYLAKRPMEQIERLQQAAAKQGRKLNGCPQVMALLREGEAQAEAGTVITEVLSFRGGGDVSGDPSYLIYLAPPGRTFFSMPMYSEGGAWKVGLAKAAELPVN